MPVTNHSSIHPECAESVKVLINSGIADFDFVPSFGSEIGMSRCAGIRALKQSDGSFIFDASEDIEKELPDFDFVLSLDSDIAFTIDQFKILLEKSIELNTVVCGVFQTRWAEHAVYAGNFMENAAPIIDHGHGVSVRDLTGNAEQVDWSSYGFSIIPRSVLIAVDAPWFCNYVVEYLFNEKKHFRYIHEDCGFSVALLRKNIPLYIHTGCYVKHLIGAV